MNDRLTVALAALLDYEQADMDGIMVETSRQAIHEVADALVAAYAHITELEENINLKADFIDKTINDCARLEAEIIHLKEQLAENMEHKD